MKCFSSFIGLLVILLINFIHLIVYFSYIFVGKKLKDFIILLILLLLLSLLLSLLLFVFLLLLFVINMHNVILLL